MRQPIDKVRMQISGKATRLYASDPQKIGGLFLVDRKERIEHRRDQHGPALVRLGEVVAQDDRRLALVIVDCFPQRAVTAGGGSELAREAAQKRPTVQPTTLLRDLRPDGFLDREMREERDDVGEGFMEGEAVDAGGFGKPPVKPVQDRVRHLVNDDVVRQGGKDPACSYLFGGGLKVAEEQCLFLAAVVRVRLAKRVRVDPELIDGPVDVVLLLSFG